MWPVTGEDMGKLLPESEGGSALDGGVIRGVTGSVRDLRAGELFVALPFVDGDAHAHVEEALRAGAAGALVSEAWTGLKELPEELRARCVIAADVLASFRAFAGRFRERLACPVVAVAGSNGKTTTKEMLAALLSSGGRRVVRTPGTDNGFVGLPRTLCDRELRAEAPPDAVVLEIGIDGPGAMAEHARMVAPDLVVITALGAEHLDGLGDVESAVREELSLLEVAPGARRVLSWGDPEIRGRAHLVRGGDVAVVVAPSAGVSSAMVSSADMSSAPGWTGAEWPPAGAVLACSVVPGGETSQIVFYWYPDGGPARPAWRGELRVPMPGAHHALDCALAVGAALAMGRSPEELSQGWRSFSPPPWRARVSRLAGGRLLVDDCFNASPLSMVAAIAMLEDPAWAGRPKVAVLGDMLELGAESGKWHLGLVGPLSRVEGLRVFFFGPEMAGVAEALLGSGPGGRVGGCLVEGDPAELVARLELSPGTVVLVKGSRGMHMERAVQSLALSWAGDRAAARRVLSEAVTVVGVVGSHGTSEVARMVSLALRGSGGPVGLHGAAGAFVGDEPISVRPGARGSFDVVGRCLGRGGEHAVVELAHERLMEILAEIDVRVAVYTGLSEGDLPGGADLERHLAEKAQVFARGGGLRVAVLCADDPTSELLAEVIPPSVRVLRYGTAGEASGPVDLLATAIEVVETGTRVTLAPSVVTGNLGEITVRERGRAFGLGALAALLVVCALGGSPEEAARHLC